MLLLYIIKQPPFFKVQKSRRVVSYKKNMTKRGYAFVDNSGLRLRYQNKYNQAAFAADKRSRDTASYARVYQTRAGFPPVDKAECSARTGIQTRVRS